MRRCSLHLARVETLRRQHGWHHIFTLSHLRFLFFPPSPGGRDLFHQAKWVPIQTLLESDFRLLMCWTQCCYSPLNRFLGELGWCVSKDLDIIVQDCTLQGGSESCPRSLGSRYSIHMCICTYISIYTYIYIYVCIVFASIYLYMVFCSKIFRFVFNSGHQSIV